MNKNFCDICGKEMSYDFYYIKIIERKIGILSQKSYPESCKQCIDKIQIFIKELSKAKENTSKQALKQLNLSHKRWKTKWKQTKNDKSNISWLLKMQKEDVCISIRWFNNNIYALPWLHRWDGADNDQSIWSQLNCQKRQRQQL